MHFTMTTEQMNALCMEHAQARVRDLATDTCAQRVIRRRMFLKAYESKKRELEEEGLVK